MQTRKSYKLSKVMCYASATYKHTILPKRAAQCTLYSNQSTQSPQPQLSRVPLKKETRLVITSSGHRGPLSYSPGWWGFRRYEYGSKLYSREAYERQGLDGRKGSAGSRLRM